MIRALMDEALNRDMELVIKLVSLGHAARQKANRKVRQPLQEAAFSVGNAGSNGVPSRPLRSCSKTS